MATAAATTATLSIRKRVVDRLVGNIEITVTSRPDIVFLSQKRILTLITAKMRPQHHNIFHSEETVNRTESMAHFFAFLNSIQQTSDVAQLTH